MVGILLVALVMASVFIPGIATLVNRRFERRVIVRNRLL